MLGDVAQLTAQGRDVSCSQIRHPVGNRAEVADDERLRVRAWLKETCDGAIGGSHEQQRAWKTEKQSQFARPKEATGGG